MFANVPEECNALIRRMDESLMMETKGLSETSKHIYRTAWYYTSNGSYFHS